MHTDWTKETTTTTGTGTVTLAQITGFPRLSDSPIATGQTVSYVITDSDGKPTEAGYGRKLASNQMSRDRIKATYASGVLDISAPTAVDLPAGTKTVLMTPISGSLLAAAPAVDSVSSGVYRYVESRHVNQIDTTNYYTFTANRCVYVPFYLDIGGEFDAVVVNVTTAAASSKLRVAVMSMTPNGYIGDKIAETGDIDSTTTGIKVAPLSATVPLVPGWYFLAYLSDGAPGLRAYNASSNSFLVRTPPLGYNASLQAIIARYEAVTAGWTEIPDTPSATTTAMTINSVFAPHAYLRMV